jgi:hypothetical protein
VQLLSLLLHRGLLLHHGLLLLWVLLNSRLLLLWVLLVVVVGQRRSRLG